VLVLCATLLCGFELVGERLAFLAKWPPPCGGAKRKEKDKFTSSIYINIGQRENQEEDLSESAPLLSQKKK
jgi:hypothetical protein